MRRKLMWSGATGVLAVSAAAAVTMGTIAQAQPADDAPPAPPSAEDLGAKINGLMNPGLAQRSTSADQDVVSGPGPAPLMYDPASVAVGDTVVQEFQVTDVKVEGDRAVATGVVTYDGVPAEKPGVVPYVLEDGKWKIDRSYICTFVTFPGEAPPAGCE